TGVYKKSSYQQEAMADYGADALLHKTVKLNELLSCIHSQLETGVDIAPDWEQETDAPRTLVC
ncbi:MAG TPA: hypothetical protein VLZ81_09305, partial [Blastocatellia bacterium]|nr:hypothetical protein [Blastocatellia bacterium]